MMVLVPLASGAIYACSGSEEQPDGPPAGYEDVLLEQLVTEETLAALVQALAKGPPADKPSQAAVLEWPSNGEKVARDPPVSFCWRFGNTAQQPGNPSEGRWASLEPFAGSPPADVAAPLRELLGPPRRALAHGEPYTGIATYLEFSTDTEPKLLRVLTSDIAFHPSQATWDTMAKTGKAITLKLITVAFEQNRVAPGEGPVAGTTMQFTISQ